MAQDDKFLAILEKLSEQGERGARLETKMERMESDVEAIKNQDAIQNRLLAEHIQGTVTNRERLEVEIQNRKDLENTVESMIIRLASLEEAPKFLDTLKKYVIYIAAIGGSAVAIWHWFK